MVTKAEQSKIGKRSRAKGNQWERDVANFFKAAGFPEAKRELNQWRKSGGIDIICVGEYIPQCMKSRVPNAFKKYGEAVVEARKIDKGDFTKIPVALLHKDSSAPGEEATQVAVVPIGWFFNVVKYLNLMSVPPVSSASTVSPTKEDSNAGI